MIALRVRQAAAALLVALSIGPAAGQTQHAAPPPLSVTLAPHASNGAVDLLRVEMRLPAPNLAAGGALLRMPTTIVGVGTAAYAADAIEARDARGRLALTAVDEAPGPSGVYRRYNVGRATSGAVTVRYATAPRHVDAQTRNGPLFDLRGEGGGILGAGVYFFATPATTTPYRISLRWDLSGMPAGSRGIWSFGEGAQTTVAPAETLAFSYYAAGPVRSEPADGSGAFALYWLSDPPFSLPEVGAYVRSLYAYMSHFFGDEHSSYRIFIRRNPYNAGGGTGLAKSFMFAYGADSHPTLRDLQMLLAHEMAHTWPTLNADEPHPLTAWYTEGTAEYYSLVLAYRAHLIDADRFLEVLNQRAEGYYGNPLMGLSNAEAGQRFWSDGRAQRVPYGRGFMYLARVNAEIRARSNGARSLDNLVLDILARQRRGEHVGLEAWNNLVAAELGDGARTEFQDMVAGHTLTPPENAFAPCFHPVQTSYRPFDLGFDDFRMGAVTNLESGGAAAAAGVREGDVIVSFTPLNTLQSDPNAEMHLDVQRGDQHLSLHYVPRGAPVQGWKWERVADVADADCHI